MNTKTKSIYPSRSSGSASSPSSSSSSAPQAPAPSASSGSSRAATAPARNRPPSHDEIAARARVIWERNGRPDGRDEQHWLQAEKELRQEGERVDEKRFADPDRLLTAEGDPADEVDRTLDRLASPPADRSPTSL